MKYALIRGGIVGNIIVSDDEAFVLSIVDEQGWDGVAAISDAVVSIGYSYQIIPGGGGVFTAPTPAPSEPAATGEPTRRRFSYPTHNWANKQTWDGSTTGAPGAKIVDIYPGSTYDDVAFCWRKPDGSAVLQLTGVDEQTLYGPAGPYTVYNLKPFNGTPKTWIGDDDAVLCRYDVGMGEWVWVPTGEVVTNSGWGVHPYAGTSMVFTDAMMAGGKDAAVQAGGTIRFTVYRGSYPVGQDVWFDISQIRKNAMGQPAKYTLPDASAGLQYFFDYSKTAPITLDAANGEWMMIALDGHMPIQGTTEAYAAFQGYEVGTRQ